MNDTRPSGRPRAFDAEAALEQIIAVFWQSGFDGATYEALERATGVRRQSLIYAFGDKRTMFLKALDRYAATRVARVCDALSSATRAKDGIETAFDLWILDARRAEHRGCLMVTTAGEIGPGDRDAAKKVASARAQLTEAFADAFERAAAQGDLRPGFVPSQLASLAVSAGDGALLHARNEARADAAEATLSGLRDLIF